MLILYLYLITMIIYFFKYRMEAFFDTPLITIQNGGILRYSTDHNPKFSRRGGRREGLKHKKGGRQRKEKKKEQK